MSKQKADVSLDQINYTFTIRDDLLYSGWPANVTVNRYASGVIEMSVVVDGTHRINSCNLDFLRQVIKLADMLPMAGKLDV